MSSTACTRRDQVGQGGRVHGNRKKLLSSARRSASVYRACWAPTCPRAPSARGRPCGRPSFRFYLSTKQTFLPAKGDQRCSHHLRLHQRLIVNPVQAALPGPGPPERFLFRVGALLDPPFCTEMETWGVVSRQMTPDRGWNLVSTLHPGCLPRGRNEATTVLILCRHCRKCGHPPGDYQGVVS